MNPLNYLYEAVGWVFTHIYDVLKPALRPDQRMDLGSFHRDPGRPDAADHGAAVHQADAHHPGDVVPAAADGSAAQEVQERQADAEPRDDEALPGGGRQPADGLPADGASAAAVLLAVQRAARDRRLEARHGATEVRPAAAYGAERPERRRSSARTSYDKVLFTSSIAGGVPLHAKIVIFCAVLVSMATTFLTIRQSQKRGMMPAATPDNPMASSQKYMTYIMPFFALTGLYWPFGLVLYWVTTNVWTLASSSFWACATRTRRRRGGRWRAGSEHGRREVAHGGGAKGTAVKGTAVKGTASDRCRRGRRSRPAAAGRPADRQGNRERRERQRHWRPGRRDAGEHAEAPVAGAIRGGGGARAARR